MEHTEEHPIRKIIGDNIRYHRVKQNWSQETLAIKCELDTEHLERIESGLENIGTDNIAKFAEVFGVEDYTLLVKNYYAN